MKTKPNRRLMLTTLPLQILALIAAGCSVETEDAARETERRDREPAQRTLVVAPDADASADVIVQDVVMRELDGDESLDEAAGEDVDHVAAGHAAWESGAFDEAARHLRAAVDADEAQPYDVYLLALSLWHSGDAAASEFYLVDACWKLETFVRAPVNLARVRLELDDLEGAREAIESALAIDADFGPAYNVYGRILLAEGNRDEAAVAFRKAAELAPSDPWPLNNLGYSLLISGDEAEAVAPLTEAVERSDAHAQIWNNLALALERTGDLGAAVAAAQRAAELDPSRDDYAATATRMAALAPIGGSAEAVALAEAVEDATALETNAAVEAEAQGESIGTDASQPASDASGAEETSVAEASRP